MYTDPNRVLDGIPTQDNAIYNLPTSPSPIYKQPDERPNVSLNYKLTIPRSFTEIPSDNNRIAILLDQQYPTISYQKYLAEKWIHGGSEKESESTQTKTSSELCNICLDQFHSNDSTMSLIKVLSCGHAFHETCLIKWLVSGHKNCPTCMTLIILEETVDFDTRFKNSREYYW